MKSWFKKRDKRDNIFKRLAAREASPSGGAVFSIALATALWVAVVVLLNIGVEHTYTGLTEGQRAPNTVVAQIDFQAPDVAATELSRRQAAEAVMPVFSIHQAPYQTALRAIEQVFDQLVAQRRRTEPPLPAPETIEVSGTTYRMSDIQAVAPEGQETVVLAAVRSALKSVWDHGIISSSEKESQFHGVAAGGMISIRESDQSLRGTTPITSLHTPDEALRKAVRLVRQETGEIPVSERSLTSLLRPWMVANLLYDPTTTDQLRQAAVRSVAPVMKTVRAGTTLVNAGDRVYTREIEELRAHDRRLSELQSPQDRRLKMIGRASLVLFALVICAGLMQILKPNIARQYSRILLLVILSLLTLLPVKGLLYLSNTLQIVSPSIVEFMLPLAIAPLLATILIGGSVAVVVGVWTGFVAAVLFNNSFSIFAMGLLVTMIVAHLGRQVRKRSDILRAGFWVGVAQMLYGLSLAVLNQLPWQTTLTQSGMALASGLLAALFTMLLLPVFETLFNITTDITLLELSDTGHPLLHRLAIEAPGTYHHSLMVANLAHSAALDIGAHALLVRVCAYFHDIGKINKPEFFVENTQFRENPHDDLTPSMSTLVIISHVKEGVTMARRYKLPKPIIDGIEQHHGTSLVLYFYHRAVSQQQAEQPATAVRTNGRAINEEDYRYPGPKPVTREMGVLLLADSVEAASRSMEKPTPKRIEQLVNEIVDSRLQDGQLDDCNLTFAELKDIKRSFIFTLTNMLHGRVPYPKDEHTSKQPPEGVSGPVGEAQDVYSVGHETITMARSRTRVE